MAKHTDRCLKLLRSLKEQAEKNSYRVYHKRAIDVFNVKLVVNGNTLSLNYLDARDVFCSPCDEVVEESEFTLRLVHKLTEQEWTLPSVCVTEVFHRERFSVLGSFITSSVYIEYNIMPQRDGTIEVKILGGSNGNYDWRRQQTSVAVDFFDFLVLLKQTDDGHNTLMTKRQLTKLTLDKLPLFAIVILDGVPQDMQRVQCTHERMDHLDFEVSAQGLCRTTHVNVLVFLELPDSKERIPLTVAYIWQYAKCHRLTFCVNIDPEDIDPDKDTVSCELEVDGEDDVHLIVGKLLALRSYAE